MDGFILLHRKIMDSDEWEGGTPEQKVIMFTLLLLVQHEETIWDSYGQKIKLRPGQALVRYDELARRAGKGITERIARTALNKLKSLGFIDVKRTKRGQIVTVNSWEKYQKNCHSKITKIATLKTIKRSFLKNALKVDKSSLCDDEDMTNGHSKITKTVTLKSAKRSLSNKTTMNINNKKELVDFTCEEFVSKYHEICPMLPRVVKVSEARRKTINARLKDLDYNADRVKDFLQEVASSSFLTGSNDTGWMASVDWIIKESNFVKIIEGNYRDRKGGVKSAGSKEQIDLSEYA